MAFDLTQVGYVGTAGPIFTADAGNGKKYIFIYDVEGGVVGLRIKEPEFAKNVGFTQSDYTLGTYSASQLFSQVPTFKAPANPNASGYTFDLSAMTTATTVPGQTGSTPTGGGTTSGGGGTTSGGGGTTSGGGGTTSGGGGTTSGGTTTYAAPTLSEQVSTFFTNYWWLVLLVVGFLLWTPVIAPALGFGKKKRR